MNIQDLRYVVAVDDHRHFGRAAEACRRGAYSSTLRLVVRLLPGIG